MIDNINNEKIHPETVDSSFQSVIKSRFETLLAQNGMRQIDLANELGTDKAYIWRIINGVQDPPFHIKRKIAEILKTDTGVIWGDPIREQNKEVIKNGQK